MGLFYTALERATKGEAEAKEESPASGGGPALVTTWEEAAQRDLAGYPLPETEATATATSEEPALGTLAQRRLVLQTIAPSETGEEADIAKEQYRILRTRVLEAMRVRKLRGLLITSAGAGEGKTRVAIDLAQQFSSLKQGRVLLVDADLRRAGLTASLVPTPTLGLTHYLKGEADLNALLWEVDPWLSVLPTLNLQEEAGELLASQRMVELLREAWKQFDLVLLDGAPVGPVVDSRILAQLTGGSLLVVRAGTTTTDAIEQAAALLSPTLLGSVLNGVRDMRRSKYGYYGVKSADTGDAPGGRP